MFATLLGDLPRPPLPDGVEPSELVRAAVEAQATAGLEPVTDGGLWGDASVNGIVERWQATAALTDRAVKAVVTGPFSGGGDVTALNATLRALAVAGCPLVEVHEPAAVTVGADPERRRSFVALQQALLEGVTGIHTSLAITGGGAEETGIETLLAAPYASLALDLVRGPDNWRLAARAPRDTGIVCGAMTAGPAGDETLEILVYALNYAASTGGRGADRVGVATAGSLADVPWTVADCRMRRLGEAVRLAHGTPDERAAVLDPRAVSSRAAALGRGGIRRARRSPPRD